MIKISINWILTLNEKSMHFPFHNIGNDFIRCQCGMIISLSWAMSQMRSLSSSSSSKNIIMIMIIISILIISIIIIISLGCRWICVWGWCWPWGWSKVNALILIHHRPWFSKIIVTKSLISSSWHCVDVENHESHAHWTLLICKWCRSVRHEVTVLAAPVNSYCLM